ncbi:hypothetical protein BaRGS_00024145 [Batillaria attramentaria]|uniref:Peroxisomal membrane protein 11C n=1 Tax=Batillaria attramentaria TaxID=370345 RepID=A0ABD0KBZ6_9CAEN
MADLVKVLESYRGKDRTIRLFTYVFMYLGGRGNTPLQAKFRKLVSELGGCRVVLRLFDDFSMLMLNLSTGFGLKQPNPWLRPLEVLSGLLNQLYYPVEHIAWLRDKEILPGNSGLLWLLGLCIWACSLFTEIIKEIDSQQNQQIDEKMTKLALERRDLILLIIQSAADLTNAISWLPKGFLWSQKLHPSANGICGLVSTLVMLYRNWPSSK